MQYVTDAKIQKVIDDTFTYLDAQEFDTALYLWMMAALKDMHTMHPKNEYLSYGKEFTLWRMQHLLPARTTNRNYCAATEGLVSAYSLLENSMTAAEKAHLRTEIDFWNLKNSGLQIGPLDSFRLHSDEGKPAFAEVQDMAQSMGGFLTADNERTQRIDFTQHCLSTYIQTLVDVDNQAL
jgi:hypothetical protein